MLFRKNVAKFCAYCKNAGQVDGKKMICSKRGFVPCSFSCYRFRYDPLKRTPPRVSPKSLKDFDPSDFSL